MNRRTLLKAIAGLTTGVSTSLLAKGPVEAEPHYQRYIEPAKVNKAQTQVIIIEGPPMSEREKQMARAKSLLRLEEEGLI